jgi:hypothetical protein
MKSSFAASEFIPESRDFFSNAFVVIPIPLPRERILLDVESDACCRARTN